MTVEAGPPPQIPRDSLVPACQWPRQGSHGSVLFELVLCITLPGVGPGEIHH